MNISATPTTPSIQFDTSTRTLVLEGESYPENSFEFYKPLLAWLDDQVKKGPLSLCLRVTYMNTSSVKCMMDAFDRLEDAHQAGAEVRVEWQHAADDERSREFAEEFKEDLTLPFAITQRSEE